MKIVLAASLLASAAAFAPASHGKASTSLKMSYESEAGAIAPTGFFDPFGLTNGIDQAKFDQLRLGEIKNGRAAMLAVIGYIVPEVFRFPGEIAPGVKFADIPNGIAAIEKVPALGWIQIFFLIGFVDFNGFLGSASPTEGAFLAFDAANPAMDDETAKTRLNNELSNGRLAMLAFWELIRHDYQNIYNPGTEPSDHLIQGLPFLYGE